MFIGFTIALIGGLIAVTIIPAWVGGLLWLFNWSDRKMRDDQ